MGRALELAARGWGRVSPNPLVGAVVARGGEVIGEGWHDGPGEPHAEVAALAAAGDSARGATMYVTLEPCRHSGRTPPCTDAIVAAGIGRLVFAVRDPHPDAGGGAGALEAAGVQVEHGLLREEGLEMNAPFLWRIVADRPFVTLKLAQSIDGRVAAARGERTAITGEAAWRQVHRMRAGADAVLIGRATAEADDPLLTSRLGAGNGAARHRPAVRVVLDTEARLPAASRLVASARETPLLLVTTDEAPRERVEVLRGCGADVTAVDAGPDGSPDPAAVLELLGRRGVNSVLVEGGIEVAHSFLDAGLVERFVQYVAPVWLGEDALSFFGPAERAGTEPAAWCLADVTRAGLDARLTWERLAAFDALRASA